jgi:hypothetical protein
MLPGPARSGRKDAGAGTDAGTPPERKRAGDRPLPRLWNS